MLLWRGKQWTTKEGARKGHFRARMHLTAVTSSHDLPPEFVLLAALMLSQGQLWAVPSAAAQVVCKPQPLLPGWALPGEVLLPLQALVLRL